MEETVRRSRMPVWVFPILLLGLGLRLTGLWWGEGYSYFCQGDGIAAYGVAVDYAAGAARAQYLGQPNFNERAKLPGPLWTLFCLGGLRLFGSIQGVILAVILLNVGVIWLTYLLADRALGPPASFWATLFAATLPSAVHYSVGVYNPDVMAFLGGLLCLALWEVIQRERSRHIFWVGLLLLIMPQFHMSGLLLWASAGALLLLSAARLNIAWLLGGLLAGALCYAPYVAGELAHGWTNTCGMVSGRGGYCWDSLKALTAPLNLLVSWVPQWTRSAGEYRELGRACFGGFGVFLGFSILSAVVAIFIMAGAVLEVAKVLRGFRRSPRGTFSRSRGLLFLAALLVVALLCALMSGRPFHARYALGLLPALLALAGCGTARCLSSPRWRRVFAVALVTTICANVWFMPALYWHQGTHIERGAVFVPSFRQLESVYQQLKAHAGVNRAVRIDDKAYLQMVGRKDQPARDAEQIRRYVAIREKEAGALSQTRGAPVTYRLCRADEVAQGNPAIAYQGHGIALIAEPSSP